MFSSLLKVLQDDPNKRYPSDLEIDDAYDMATAHRRRRVFESCRHDKAEVDRARDATLEPSPVRDTTRLIDAAVEHNDVELVRDLIAAGAELNRPGTFVVRRHRWPLTTAVLPVHWAAHCGFVEILRLLVDAGVSVHSVAPGGCDTALRFALSNGHVDCVRFLLARGASMDDLTLLRIATPNLADLMLARVEANAALLSGVDLDELAWRLLESELPQGALLLDLALQRGAVLKKDLDTVAFGHVDTVDLLFRRGMKLQAPAHGNTDCLSRAIARGRFAVARRLYECGAYSIDKLIYSARLTVEMVEFILSVDARVGANTRHAMWLVMNGVYRDASSAPAVLAACERLLEAGAPLAADESGETALHHAADRCDVVLMSFFIERGCDVNARDKNGFTPLARVCTARDWGVKVRTDARQWLIGRFGVEIIADVVDNPAVMSAACVASHDDVVRFLVRYGSDINQLHDDESSTFRQAAPTTPLQKAALHNSDEIVRFLLLIGARVPESLVEATIARGAWKSLIALIASGRCALPASPWKPLERFYGHDWGDDLSLFLVLLMLDLVPEAAVSTKAPLFVAACWWGLPIDDSLLPAMRTRTFAIQKRAVVRAYEELLDWINGQKVRLINWRATEICIALHDIGLPALLTLMILDEACPLAPFVRLHSKWQLVAKVKQFK
jgi:ankyrin repeat protein